MLSYKVKLLEGEEASKEISSHYKILTNKAINLETS